MQHINHVKGGLVMDDVITNDEALNLIDKSFVNGFRDKRVVMFAGDRERATFMDQALADLIWTRIEKRVMCIHYNAGCETYYSTCNMQPSTGLYKPVGINPFMRVSKYNIGQSFRWHVDTMYGTGQDNIGFQTLLLYLNDDFDGGETSFRTYISGEEDPIIQRVTPKTGSVLLFDHAQEHQGNIIRNGRKIVLRTEVMFAKM